MRGRRWQYGHYHQHTKVVIIIIIRFAAVPPTSLRFTHARAALLYTAVRAAAGDGGGVPGDLRKVKLLIPATKRMQRPAKRSSSDQRCRGNGNPAAYFSNGVKKGMVKTTARRYRTESSIENNSARWRPYTTNCVFQRISGAPCTLFNAITKCVREIMSQLSNAGKRGFFLR